MNGPIDVSFAFCFVPNRTKHPSFDLELKGFYPNMYLCDQNCSFFFSFFLSF
jgi:hypothetical protein